jgi:hypothetical protein
MQKILLCLVALSMGACAHQPYTVAPSIPKLNVAPIKTGNDAIAKGNKAISEGNKGVKTQLEDTRSKLDAAIVAAHENKEQNAKLDKALEDARDSLALALQGNAHMFDTIGEQDDRIAAQTKAIDDLQAENESRQKIIDLQTKNLNESRQEAADLKKIKDQVNAYWGLGAFLYGAKRLGWRLLIVAVILSVLGFVLNLFVPELRPLFTAIVGFFVKIPGRLARFVTGLFRRKPPDNS